MEHEVVTRSHGMHVRALRPHTREVDFVASTDAIDSFDEVVEQSWRLDRYLSNPVVLFAHQSRELPIGKCTRVVVIDGQLECTIQFATADMNPKAEQVFRMVQEKILNAVSVGFMPRSIRHEMRDGREVYVLSDNELHEISVTPIPANPEALAKMKAKARAEAVHTGETDMTFEQLKAERDAAVAASEKAIAERATADVQAREFDAKASKAIEERDAAIVERDAAIAANAKHLEIVKVESEQIAKSLEDVGIAKVEGETFAGRVKRLADAKKAADDKVTDMEVAALVGVKILPAEKDAMASLAKKDRESFDALIAARPELSLLSQVVPATKTKESASIDPAQELASLALRATAEE